MGCLPEEGSAGQGRLEAACRLLDNTLSPSPFKTTVLGEDFGEHLEGVSSDTLTPFRHSDYKEFQRNCGHRHRGFSSRDLFHMYLPVNYRTNKSNNFIVVSDPVHAFNQLKVIILVGPVSILCKF